MNHFCLPCTATLRAKLAKRDKAIGEVVEMLRVTYPDRDGLTGVEAWEIATRLEAVVSQ